MKRPVSTLLSLLPFVAIAALGIWMFNPNPDETETEARVEQTEPAVAEAADAPPPMSVLEMEQRRLAELRARLDEVKPSTEAPAEALDARIATAQQKVTELQNEIGTNAEEAAPAPTAAGGGDDVVKIALEKQLQGLDTEILEAQTLARQKPESAELKEQVEALKARRDDLNARITQVQMQPPSTLTEVAGQTPPAGGEMMSESEDRQRRLADVKSDLEYWQSQKSGAGATAQTARLKKLQDEIQAQEERVKALESLNPVTQ